MTSRIRTITHSKVSVRPHARGANCYIPIGLQPLSMLCVVLINHWISTAANRAPSRDRCGKVVSWGERTLRLQGRLDWHYSLCDWQAWTRLRGHIIGLPLDFQGSKRSKLWILVAKERTALFSFANHPQSLLLSTDVFWFDPFIHAPILAVHSSDQSPPAAAVGRSSGFPSAVVTIHSRNETVDSNSWRPGNPVDTIGNQRTCHHPHVGLM
eukprot:SAG31_NODE_1597_length_7799_cov_37.912857_7_plen_211_part_00